MQMFRDTVRRSCHQCEPRPARAFGIPVTEQTAGWNVEVRRLFLTLLSFNNTATFDIIFVRYRDNKLYPLLELDAVLVNIRGQYFEET